MPGLSVRRASMTSDRRVSSASRTFIAPVNFPRPPPSAPPAQAPTTSPTPATFTSRSTTCSITPFPPQRPSSAASACQCRCASRSHTNDFPARGFSFLHSCPAPIRRSKPFCHKRHSGTETTDEYPDKFSQQHPSSNSVSSVPLWQKDAPSFAQTASKIFFVKYMLRQPATSRGQGFAGVPLPRFVFSIRPIASSRISMRRSAPIRRFLT